MVDNIANILVEENRERKFLEEESFFPCFLRQHICEHVRNVCRVLYSVTIT